MPDSAPVKPVSASPLRLPVRSILKPAQSNPIPISVKPLVHLNDTTPVMRELEQAAIEFDQVAESVNGGIEAIEARLQRLPAKANAFTDSPTNEETSQFIRYSYARYAPGEWRIFYQPGVDMGNENIDWHAERPLLLAKASADLKIDAVPHLISLVVAITETLKTQSSRLRQAKAALQQIVPFVTPESTDPSIDEADIPF